MWEVPCLDIIAMYCFGHSIGALDRPDLGRTWGDIMGIGVKINPFARTFPFIARRLLTLPKWMTSWSTEFQGATEFLDLADQLSRGSWDEALEEKANGKAIDDAQHRTVLHSMIWSETLPDEEKTYPRLAADGLTLLAAGFDTTSRTLAVIMYHLLAKPGLRLRVLQELRTIMPSSKSDLPTVAQLERLPFLTAVIHEGTRLGHGVAGRLVRIAPAEDLYYSPPDGSTVYQIPRGATFSQSSYLIHTNQDLYPNPHEFNPERYLTTDGSVTDAQRYLVAFGKGTRACSGINLAFAEMYLALAALVGSVSLKLAEETTLKSVTIQKELFVGILPEKGPFINVKVLGEL